MKIAVSPYRLTPRPGSGSEYLREGALLRVEFEPGKVGYADCHPWPELWDIPIAEQFQVIEMGYLTPQLQRSCDLALLDASARAVGVSLFDSLKIPKSHASFPHALLAEDPLSEAELDRLVDQGFDRVKVKGGGSPDFEIARLAEMAPMLRDRNIHLRLDINQKLSTEQAGRYLRYVAERSGGLDWIEWVEDPCPFDEAAWTELRRTLGIKLAVDLAVEPRETSEAFDVIVLKPAVREPSEVFRLGAPVCVTSYLDHPVGQLGAALVAGLAAADGVPLEVCGLVTQDVYEETPFSTRLGVDEGRLTPPGGTGIGFDEELASLDWRELN